MRSSINYIIKLWNTIVKYFNNKEYAEMNNTTLSELIRNAIIEKIGDEYDLQCYEKAIEEYRKIQ